MPYQRYHFGDSNDKCHVMPDFFWEELYVYVMLSLLYTFVT